MDDLNDIFAEIDGLPEGFDRGSFSIPPVEVVTQGKNTLIQNYLAIVKQLKRESKHLKKFISSELGILTKVQGKQLWLSGSFTKSKIQQVLIDYIQTYIICPHCKKPDTHLKTSKKKQYLHCTACGKETHILRK